MSKVKSDITFRRILLSESFNVWCLKMNRDENAPSRNEKSQSLKKSLSSACLNRCWGSLCHLLEPRRLLERTEKLRENSRTQKESLDWSNSGLRYHRLYYIYFDHIVSLRARRVVTKLKSKCPLEVISVNKSSYVQFHFMVWEISQGMTGTHIPLLSNCGSTESKLLFFFQFTYIILSNDF